MTLSQMQSKGEQCKASSGVKGQRLQSRCLLLSKVTGVKVLVVEQGHQSQGV